MNELTVRRKKRRNAREYKDLRDLLTDWYEPFELEEILNDWTDWATGGDHPGMINLYREFKEEIIERGEIFKNNIDEQSIFAPWFQLTGFVVEDLCEKILYEIENPDCAVEDLI